MQPSAWRARGLGFASPGRIGLGSHCTLDVTLGSRWNLVTGLVNLNYFPTNSLDASLLVFTAAECFSND